MTFALRSRPVIYWGTGNLASFGGSSDSSPSFTGDVSTVHEALRVLRRYGVGHIDTAQRYGNGQAEEVLGRALAEFSASAEDCGEINSLVSFAIDTKWVVPQDRAMTAEDILRPAQRSRMLLTNNKGKANSSGIGGITSISTFYLHTYPDQNSEDTLLSLLAAINTLHQSRVFTHFGLSNFSSTQIQLIYDLAQSRGYVLPTVYQGMYNAVHRDAERDLFPLLRQLGIAFRAYSPLAGGFLTKTRAGLTGSGQQKGRFSKDLKGTAMSQYIDTYVTPSYMLDALDEWDQIAVREGVSRAELAYRWAVHHSALQGRERYGGASGDDILGDGIIIGARNIDQLNETLEWSVNKGELSDKAVTAIQQIWNGIEEARGQL